MTADLTPDRVEDTVRQIRALRELGRFAEALRLTRSALASDPDDVRLLMEGSVLAVALDDYAQATELAQGAVRVAPGYAMPLVLLAQARRLSDDVPGALEAARQALHLDPEEMLAHFELGVALTQQADGLTGRRRRPLLAEAWAAASQVDRLAPEDASGPALLALIHALEDRWPQHEAEVERALAREPDDPFAHNVRLMGLQLRRGVDAITPLYERLRERPGDEYARQGLRAQFSFVGWWRLYWGRWWWLLVVMWFTRLIGLVLLSLPLYFLWRQRRIRRFPEIYQAVFTPAERQRGRLAHLVLFGPMLVFGVLLAVGAFFPALFTRPAAVYGPVWLLTGLLLLTFTVPAALTGRGGLFGRAPDELTPRVRPSPLPWTLSRLAWPLLFGLLTLPAVIGAVVVLGMLLVGLVQGESVTELLASATLLGILALVVLLTDYLFIYRARYGVLPTRLSVLDGVVALFTLLAMLVFGGDVLHALGLLTY